jgi:hypothetical protein
MRDDGSQPWKSRQRFKRRKPEAAHKEYKNRKQDIHMFFLQRQELLVLRTCGFQLCYPETKRLLIQTWRRQKLHRNITMTPVHRIYRLQIQMDSPPSRLSLFRPFSLSPSVYYRVLENKEGGGGGVVVPNKDNSRKKRD